MVIEIGTMRHMLSAIGACQMWVSERKGKTVIALLLMLILLSVCSGGNDAETKGNRQRVKLLMGP